MNFLLGSFVIGILNLDTTSFIQSSISRPSFVGLLFGFINGVPLEGFVVGLLTEFVVLDFPPIGGMPTPNGCISAGFASFFITICGVYLSFFLGLLVGFFYSYVEKILREKRKYLNDYVRALIEKNDFCFGRVIVVSIMIEFIVCFVYVFFLLNLFSAIFSRLSLNSPYLNEAFKLSFISVIFVVLSSLFFKFLTQIRKNA